MAAQTTLNSLALRGDRTPELIAALGGVMYPQVQVVEEQGNIYNSEPVIPNRTKAETLEDWDWDGLMAAGMVPDGFVEAQKREDEE